MIFDSSTLIDLNTQPTLILYQICSNFNLESIVNTKPELENCLQCAIATKKEDPDLSLNYLAETFGVSNTTLHNHFKDSSTPCKVAHESHQLLSHLDENVIVQSIQNCNDCGISHIRKAKAQAGSIWRAKDTRQQVTNKGVQASRLKLVSPVVSEHLEGEIGEEEEETVVCMFAQNARYFENSCLQ